MNDLEKAYWLVFDSGLTPYELSKKLGVSTTLVYRWQKDDDTLRRIQRKTLDKLVSVYDSIKKEKD